MITRTTKTGFIGCRSVELSELYGLSTDDKPLDVENGSIFLEMDTGDVFTFDVDNKKWWELLPLK